MGVSGTSITFSAGERILARNAEVDCIYIILKGKIKAMSTYGEILMGPGSIPGLLDVYYGINIFNYIAEEETLVRSYPATELSDIISLLSVQKDNLGIYCIMQNRFTAKLIEKYIELCVQAKKTDESFHPDEHIAKWEIDKFNSIIAIPSKTAIDYYTANSNIAIGTILDAARFSSTLNDACLALADSLEIDLDYVPEEPEEEDIFALDDSDVFVNGIDENEQAEDGKNATDADDALTLSILSELENSAAKIISFSKMERTDAEGARKFEELLGQFKALPKDAISDEARTLRRELTKAFYKLYLQVFMQAKTMRSLPNIISMFLNFGYVDETLISKENLVDIYKYSGGLEHLYARSSTYTMYRWLMAIYTGEKEPSVNGLEQSYPDYVRQLRKNGQINEKQEQSLLNDQQEKVKFEIENMFTQAGRGVCAKNTNYVPILTDHLAPRALSQLLCTGERVKTSLDMIKAKDFSAFYREIIFVDKKTEIEREFIMKEVMPDVILLPQLGSAGLMWQEIENRKKDSPARFIMPIFPIVSIQALLVSLTARFKWEMCKRIQGAYWNNISERSLTSEYCDYLQFYKKNHEISDTGKAKLKSQLSSCRNNYREVFVKDYEIWMTYEVAGSARLNKCSRRIVSKYSPLPAVLRERLKDNPLFADCMATNERDLKIKENHLDLVLQSLKKKGFQPPNELLDYKAFLEK